MKMRKLVLLLTLVACLSVVRFWSAAAQSVDTEQGKVKVSGKVVEAGPESPLSLSKVAVCSLDGNVVARTLSLDDGSFRVLLAKGKYLVLIEKIGYRSTKMTIEVGASDMSLGDIVLEIGEELDAASVESSSLISRRGTRITYDVSNDPDAAKISMTDMASRIPSLNMGTKHGRLEFELKPISKILINDEENGLINVRRQYPMEFIKANHMKTIEVVLPGDPEYNNTEPILLITLAKKLPYGFAGQLQTSSDTKNNHDPAVDVVANTPLIGVGAGYAYSFAGAPALTNETIRQMDDKTVESCSTSSQRASSHNFSANVFRDFYDGKFRLKARLSGAFSDASSLSRSETKILSDEGGLIESNVTSLTGSSKSPFRLNGVLSMSGEFGKKQKKAKRLKNSWRADYAYSSSRDETVSEYPGKGSDITEDGRSEHRATVSLTMRDVELDPVHASLNFNGGYYNRHFTNRSAFISESRGLDYRQHVSFLDARILGNTLEQRLSFSLLLKGEYIANDGYFSVSGESSPLDWHEFNFLPVATVGWNFKRGRLGLMYSRNVNRPSINQLNPYVDHSNPYHLVTGNPQLKGAVNDMVSLSYGLMPATVKWIHSIGAGLSWSGSNNTISRIVEANTDGIALSSFANIGRNNSLSAEIMAFFFPSTSLGINLMATYTKTWVTLPDGMTNSFDSPNVMVGIKWNPKWFELSGTVAFRPSINSVQSAKLIMEPSGEVSVSRYFKKPHLGVSVYASDIFHSGGRKESVILGSNFTQYNYFERLGRTFGIRVYWRFGQFRSVEVLEVKAYDM